jgi:hypothetical protein
MKKIEMTDLKICNKCGVEKTRAEFPKKFAKSKNLDHRVKSHCKACDAKRLKQRVLDYRAANPDAVPKRVNGVNVHKINIAWITKYKESLCCTDCGMSFKDKSCCCDFHHTDPNTKSFGVGSMIKHISDLKLIQDEIAKCIPLCANCHRLRHYKRPSYA